MVDILRLDVLSTLLWPGCTRVLSSPIWHFRFSTWNHELNLSVYERNNHESNRQVVFPQNSNA